MIGRRDFITLLGGAAAWPVAARAQQTERMRRIGVLMTTDDAEGQARMGAFLQGLQHLGWVDGRNVRVEARWTVGKARILATTDTDCTFPQLSFSTQKSTTRLITSVALWLPSE
jgi:hypothetical protein